jgi:tetratricopeptide (TPR) repeat protein
MVPAKTEREYWVMQRQLIRHGAYCLTIIVEGILVAEGEEWTLQKLGDLFGDQSRFDEAEAMYDLALQGKEKVLGSDHKSTLDTVNNLGNLYSEQGRLDEAEACMIVLCKAQELIDTSSSQYQYSSPRKYRGFRQILCSTAQNSSSKDFIYAASSKSQSCISLSTPGT